ncbi:hypothetical protein [Streptomyces sp. NPDC057966]|uniref:hypothetical protein n=1 Tax=Streptomyces sp. NPDC057966 TaxID=3346292 RepID=UPI0036ED8075
MANAGKQVAKAEDDNGDPVYRWMLQRQPWPFAEPLKCAGCTRPVSIVPTHLRRGTPVLTHFRWREGHDESCPLDPTHDITDIAHGSHGLAKVMKNGTLRLTIPAHDPPSTPAPTTLGGEPEDDEERTRLRVTTLSPWLPPALNSAVKVAQFLQRHDFDPDFMELFTVQYQAKRLAWNEFCYGPDNPSYRRFRDRVAAAKGRRLKHPVAVHGTVTRTGTAGTKPFAVLATRIPTGQTGRTTEVVLRSDFPALLGEELRVGMQVLAIGAGWKIFTPQKRSVDEVQLWIKEHWNLAYWTWDKDTEQAGAPMCPPPLTPDARRNSRPARRPIRRPSSPARRPAAPPAPSPLRASAPQHEHRTAEPPGQPAPAGEASSDDLARLTLKAYTNTDRASPSATADQPPSTLAPPAAIRRSAPPMPSALPTPVVPGPVAAPTPRPQPAAPAVPTPPRPALPPLPSPPAQPVVGASAPQSDLQSEATATKRIRRLFARWRRDR